MVACLTISSGLVKDNQQHTNQPSLEAISQGSHESFAQLYNGYHKLVFAYAFKSLKCQSEADDIVQQTFKQLWEHRKKLARVESIKDYIFIVSRNLIFAHLKAKMRHETLSEELKIRVQLLRQRESDEDLIYADFEKVVKVAVAALPKQRRLIFELSKEKNYTHDEIAAYLSISKNTVKESLRKAHGQIRKHLAIDTDLFLSISLLAAYIRRFF